MRMKFSLPGRRLALQVDLILKLLHRQMRFLDAFPQLLNFVGI